MSGRRFERASVLAFVASIGFAAAAQAEIRDYTIYKESDPVGHDIYAISQDGDVTRVKVHTHTIVNVLFLKFHYDHDRTEIWKNGIFQSVESTTDDDGTKHQMSIHRDGDKLVGTVDGKARTIPGDALPFTVWAKALVRNQLFFDIADGDQLKTTVEDKGEDKIAIGQKTYDTHHFKISGDLNWDLWYEADGVMLKSAFKRRGFPVFFVKE
jgi:hypothetical protein